MSDPAVIQTLCLTPPICKHSFFLTALDSLFQTFRCFAVIIIIIILICFISDILTWPSSWLIPFWISRFLVLDWQKKCSKEYKGHKTKHKKKLRGLVTSLQFQMWDFQFTLMTLNVELTTLVQKIYNCYWLIMLNEWQKCQTKVELKKVLDRSPITTAQLHR